MRKYELPTLMLAEVILRQTVDKQRVANKRGTFLRYRTFTRYIPHSQADDQWLKCKLEVGERYIQVWTPDNGHVPIHSNLTI